MTSDLLPSRPSRWLVSAWAVLAGLNLGAGLAIARVPTRQFDLEAVQRWGRQWLVDGTELYGAAGSMVD